MSSRNLNQVDLIGNLGRDPELRKTNSESSVTSVPIATNRQWKSANGSQNEETEWHDVVFFGKLAEIACQILNKSDKVHVKGRIHSRHFADDSGNETKRVEIVADNFILLDQHPSNQKPQSQELDSSYTNYTSI